jgi:hypothetical protein
VDNVRWAWDSNVTCTLQVYDLQLYYAEQMSAAEILPICIQIVAFWNIGRIAGYAERVAGFP